MTELEKIIGYEFNNRELLEIALTHSSFANEHSKAVVCNERLEFLGDSVLSLVVSTFIYNNFPDYPGSIVRLLLHVPYFHFHFHPVLLMQ